MKNTALALMLGLGCSMAVLAEQAPYGAVMGSYVKPDDKRNAGFGLGGQVVFVGVPLARHLNFELGGFANTLHRSSDNGNDAQYALGADLMVPLFGANDGSHFEPFLLAGGGGVYDDLAALKGSRDFKAYMDFGGGALFKFTKRLSLRAEVREVIDYNEKVAVPDSSAQDLRFNLGVQYTFFVPPPPPPAVLPTPPQQLAPPPPADSDGDGVPDSRDECPNTPKGVQVDARGCPLDSDGDGVPDYRDKCPGTPKGFKVDADGCIVEQTIVLRTVTFEFNKATLTPDSKDALDNAVAAMNSQPKLSVEVSGHTDSKGSAAYNQRLSKHRAESVRAYLVSKGVAADRISAMGYGKTKPIASNDTEAGRAENRRVEFKVLTKPLNVKVLDKGPTTTHPEKAPARKARKKIVKPKPAVPPATTAPAAAPAAAPAPAAPAPAPAAAPATTH